jgi:hypothetical protein
MGFWSRLKSIAGGDIPTATLASASTLVLPDNRNVFLISGSTTVNLISAPPYTRGRLITLIGSDSCNVTFTNNNTTTTTGQMNLRGANVQLLQEYVLQLWLKDDGTLLIVNTTSA